jgi:uncharacterized protein (TIGR00251 family)
MSQLIKIKVKPNSNKNEIIDCDNFYKVNVKKPAEDNKANIEVIKMFSKKFNKRVKIVKGLKSKDKILKVG